MRDGNLFAITGDETSQLSVGERFTLSAGGAGMGPEDHLWVYEVTEIKPTEIRIKRCERVGTA